MLMYVPIVYGFLPEINVFVKQPTGHRPFNKHMVGTVTLTGELLCWPHSHRHSQPVRASGAECKDMLSLVLPSGAGQQCSVRAVWAQASNSRHNGPWQGVTR